MGWDSGTRFNVAAAGDEVESVASNAVLLSARLTFFIDQVVGVGFSISTDVCSPGVDADSVVVGLGWGNGGGNWWGALDAGISAAWVFVA